MDSSIRATVLSFKGLALNLGLGVASLLYTGYVRNLRAAASLDIAGEELETTVFIDSLGAFPLYFLLLFLIVIGLAKIMVSDCSAFFKKPSPNQHHDA